MDQLSGLDATFLYLETPEMPMHVGGLQVYELPAGYKGRFVRELRRHVTQRLGVARVLRRRLWWMPLNMANPAWVDAVPDMQQHIVEIKLPRSARIGTGMAELQAQVGHLHTVLLDRTRPLWKLHVFEGLAPAANGHKRVAVYTQLHHAAVDGHAAVALGNALFDLGPVPAPVPARVSKRRKIYRLEMTEMLRGVLGNQAQQVAHIVRSLPATVGTLTGAARQAITRAAFIGGNKSSVKNLTLAPLTPLNLQITAQRAFATVSLPLPELKALGKAHGATINDMVLVVCSSALRRYFGKRRSLPRKSLIAAVPVSLREKGDTSPDNQASMSLISLGTNIADMRRRLDHVKAATGAMKATLGSVKSILPTDFPSLGMPWLMEAVTALAGKARAADRLPQVANLVISNVPGPPVPLYLAGARMCMNYPTSIVTHGLGLNITVQSYDQSLDFGLMADAKAMPDVQELADAIAIAFDDLRVLSMPGESDEDAPEPGGVLKRARRGLSDALGSAVGRLGKAVPEAAQRVVGSALGQVVTQVTGRSRASAPTARKPRR
ncbi:MAG: wax ester/triacylglycerol synthase family O-acyltransferase [Rubrivivax sp.]